MSYTWEDVLLGIDVRNEQTAKQKQERDIREEQQAESTAAGWWSLGLSILGGALWGPAGYFLGKQAGRYGADWAHKWEADEIDVGKFYKEETKELNRILDKEAEDQTGAQVINTVTDLASMYVQAGGLKEGPTDFTTFGSGEDQWRVFERGTPAQPGVTIEPVPGEFLDLPATAASADYTPGLWQSGEGLFKNLANVGMSVGGVYATDQLDTLGRMSVEYWQNKEEEDSK